MPYQFFLQDISKFRIKVYVKNIMTNYIDLAIDRSNAYTRKVLFLNNDYHGPPPIGPIPIKISLCLGTGKSF